MDWLLRPLLFLAIFTSVFGGFTKECLYDMCSTTYKHEMDENDILDPMPTVEYCDIVTRYKACLKENSKSCRGNLNYHGAVHGTDKVFEVNCGPNVSLESTNKAQERQKQAQTARPMRPSCQYFGTFKFRHCGIYGDPHLKTFGGVYQTCGIMGTWTLIENAYMSVKVTSAPVSPTSAATAINKILVWVKGEATPCTLAKRYEADSSRLALPTTFADGTDRSGADKTVTLEVESHPEEDRESAEIVMRYIASRLIIRRKGRYLAFNAKIPEELLPQYDDGNSDLCSNGCPASEQLNPILSRGHVIEREEALRLCRNTENLGKDIANNLTDNYLDWCVFDVMTAGKDKDFIDAAHSAQSDALKLDANSLRNRTALLEIPYESIKFNKASKLSYELPFCIFGLILSSCRFLTL